MYLIKIKKVFEDKINKKYIYENLELQKNLLKRLIIVSLLPKWYKKY